MEVGGGNEFALTDEGSCCCYREGGGKIGERREGKGKGEKKTNLSF